MRESEPETSEMTQNTVGCPIGNFPAHTAVGTSTPQEERAHQQTSDQFWNPTNWPWVTPPQKLGL